jgi:hypothetical protein
MSVKATTGILVAGTATVLLALWWTAPAPAPKPDTEPEPTQRQARILQFYAYPPVVAKGEQTSVCYGVENVRSVRLEPAIEPITPSPNRCIKVSPATTTDYKLIAEGDDGQTVSESLSIEVRGAARVANPGVEFPGKSTKGTRIDLFRTDKPSVAAGESVSLCYAVSGGGSVTIEPEVMPGTLPARGCLSAVPRQTTTYTLRVRDGDATESKTVTVTVQ